MSGQYWGDNMDLISARSSEVRDSQDGVKPTRIVTAVVADPEEIDENYYEPAEGLSVVNTDTGLATLFREGQHSRLQNWIGIIANHDNNEIGGPQIKVSSIVTTGQVIYHNTSAFDHSLYEKIAVLTPNFVASFGNPDLMKAFKNLYADIHKDKKNLPALTIPARFLFSEGGLIDVAKGHLAEINGTPIKFEGEDGKVATINNLKIADTKIAPSYSDAIRSFISGTREVARIAANNAKGKKFIDFHKTTETSKDFEEFMTDLKANDQFIEALRVVTNATIAYYSSVPKFLCVSKAKSGRNGTCQY